MGVRKKIAIIGANAGSGRTIAINMDASYDLLLIDSNESELQSLVASLGKENQQGIIESLACCREASWEADIVVIIQTTIQLEEIASKIKDVTTRKPVICFLSNETHINRLQNLLPFANVVDVWVDDETQAEDHRQSARIHGKDENALKTTHEILSQSFRITPVAN